MRHYEIVFLVHPDQSDQVASMIERYSEVVTGSGGAIHRVEDWGRRQMAYAINKVRKAHYVLMNVEADQSAIDEIQTLFRFNDIVLRNLIIKRDQAITEESPLAKAPVEERETPAPSTSTTESEESSPADAEIPAEQEEVAEQGDAAEQDDATDTEESAEKTES